MALNLRNRATEKLVREYARKRGIGLTEAVHEAVQDALRRDGTAEKAPGELLREKLKPLFERMDRYPRAGLGADKAFFDDMWGQGGD